MAEKQTTGEKIVSQTKEEIIKEAQRIEEATIYSAKGHFAASPLVGFASMARIANGCLSRDCRGVCIFESGQEHHGRTDLNPRGSALRSDHFSKSECQECRASQSRQIL